MFRDIPLRSIDRYCKDLSRGIDGNADIISIILFVDINKGRAGHIANLLQRTIPVQ